MNKDITAFSKVNCSHLSIQKDSEDEFTIGDHNSGEFLRVPSVAVDVIELLNGKLTIGEVTEAVNKKYTEEVDVIDFVMTLMDCELVLSIDGKMLNPEIQRAPNPILQKLGTFFFSSISIIFYILTCITSISLFILNPDLFPKFKDLFVYETVGISAFNILIVGWLLTLLHEVGHLLAASKENIPSRIRLNLRMIWLVAETDMTGLWSRPKKKRYVPFLAGMMWDATIILAFLIIQQASDNQLIINYSKLIVFLVTFAVLLQFVIFLRTDLYFVVSNWKNTSSLHQNSMIYLQKTFLRRDFPDWDELPEYEKKNAIWYGFLYGIGGFLAITLFLFFQAPPIIYALALIYEHLTDYSINSFYFWDSAILLLVILLQVITWVFGLRNSLTQRKERRESMQA